MYAKRIIPCLDIKDGRVVKGTNFLSLRDAGDPVEAAALYDSQGGGRTGIPGHKRLRRQPGHRDSYGRAGSRAHLYPLHRGGRHTQGGGLYGHTPGRSGQGVCKLGGFTAAGAHKRGSRRLWQPVRGGGHGRETPPGWRVDPLPERRAHRHREGRGGVGKGS